MANSLRLKRKDQQFVEAQLDWAATIARRVAASYSLHGSHVDDLIQIAHFEVCRLFKRFDQSLCPPGGDLQGLFRGWGHQSVFSACRDECLREPSGGLTRKRRRIAIRCGSLGEMEAELEAREENQEPGDSGQETAAARRLSRPLLRTRTRTAQPVYGRRLAGA